MRANLPRRPLAASLTLALCALAGACVETLDVPRDSGADADPERKDAAGQMGCPSGTRALSGRRVDPSRACIGESSALGCSTAASCDDAETVVRDPEGGLWWLANLCIPKNFEALPAAKEQEILSWKRCGALSQPSDGATAGYPDAGGYSDAGTPDAGGYPDAGSCGNRGREGCSPGECAVLGYPADKVRGCFGSPKPLGCMPADSYCPPEGLLVRDRDGGTWSFPSGCLVDGFTRLTGTEQEPFDSFDRCELPSRPARPCLELDTSTCSKDARCLVLRGIQYDPLRHCRWPGYAEFGCADATNGCSTIVTHASYDDERVPSYQFPSGCIPNKFVIAPAGGENVDPWPVCPEAAASARDL